MRKHRNNNNNATTRRPVGDGLLEPVPVLAGALGFGLVFGFLLQKGGVAKFDILIGVLLLEDFTVVKVMITAIIVGMLGVPLLRRAGRLQLHIKPTVLGANVLGGLLFGVGFGLLAYCPGTNAAALGQGNLDALIGVVGLVAGSYLFALTSREAKGPLTRWGDLGERRLVDVVPLPPWATTLVVAAALVGVLVVLEMVIEPAALRTPGSG